MARLTFLPIMAGLVLAGVQWLIWSYAPVEASMGLVQKIFYYHLPMAWWALISFFVVFLASLGYLFTRRAGFDQWAGAAAELGVVMSALALITGTLWARPAWNVWWTWDPRLTTTLIMWFVYASYLLIRSSPLGRERRRLICAVLGVVAFLDVPLVFFSARMWRSVHPAVLASQGGGLEPEMWQAVVGSLTGFGLLWICLLTLRARQLGHEGRVSALLALRAEYRR
ncbi:MAG: cytochrome c biogenesis protein CcsA [Desulfovibrionaceae bacterium]